MELIVKNSLHCLIISTRADAQLVQEQIDKKIIKNQKIKKSKNQKIKNIKIHICRYECYSRWRYDALHKEG